MRFTHRTLLGFLLLLLSSMSLSALPPGPQRPRLAVDLLTEGWWGSQRAPATFPGGFSFNVFELEMGLELYRSDLTPEGTRLVADICPGRCWGNMAFVGTVGERLLFHACDEIRGCQLWAAPTANPDEVERLTNFSPRFDTSTVIWGEAVVSARSDGEVWLTDATDGETTFLTKLFKQPQLEPAGDNLFMIAGQELWWSDGLRVERRFTATDFWIPGLLTVGGRVFFVNWTKATDGTITGTLNVSDGTVAGTRRVWEEPGMTPYLVFTDGLRAFFILQTTVDGIWHSRLWQSDGSPEGTRPVFIGPPGSTAVPVADVSSFQEGQAVVHDGRLYFSTAAPESKLLSIGVGTDDVRVVMDLPGNLRDVTVSGPYIYWTIGHTVYRSTGTPETTVQLWTGSTAAISKIVATPQGVVFRAARDIITSDGTVDGTKVFERPTRPVSSYPWFLKKYGDQLLFSPYIGSWITDGTMAGTRQISRWDDIAVSAGDRVVLFSRYYDPWVRRMLLRGLADDGSHVNLTPYMHINQRSAREYNGALYFLAAQASFQLWRSDGTVDGTRIVAADLGPSPYYYSRDFLVGSTEYQDTLFLTADNTLWRSDGTTTGTDLVARAEDLCHCDEAVLRGLQATGGRLFFFVISRDVRQLWTFDDTNGPTFVADLEKPLATPLTAAAGDRIVFALRKSDDLKDVTAEIWGSDGTADGTRRLRTLVLGPFPIRNSGPSAEEPLAKPFTSFAGRVFFTAEDGVHGQELWVSDGTEAGTRLYADLYPGLEPGAPQELKVIGNRLFFAADDGVHGVEPWVITPNLLNPRRLNRPSFVGDLYPGPLSSSPAEFTAVGNKVFFSASHPEAGVELWSMDLGGRVFRDGFESGGLSAWSVAVP